MAPYNLRPHPKPARPTNGTPKQSQQSKRKKEKQTISLQRGLLSRSESSMRLEYATQINSLESPLLRLPAEIRIKIFEYVLVDEKSIQVYRKVLRSSPLARVRQCRPACVIVNGKCRIHTSHLSILRVCRQIYNESALIFYSQNTFHFPLDDGHMNRIAAALREGQRHAVYHIELCSEVLTFKMNRRRRAKDWNKHIFYSKQLSELFPNLQSVKLDDAILGYPYYWLRIFSPSAPSWPVLADVREMLLGGAEDVKLVLPRLMADTLNRDQSEVDSN
ncbi:hypothetical protein P171DRAFT_474548 [Karstenula rhodostoma CBS 690.94]|uniref:DUF7730 domain-containing protein n=1 Tax=Karstenula rhodostoma CBS 690.94 TaxID=1392251 RepID=A0A9P4PDU9_9PLEO|nr:hypothetical protein P171DRAFT_474548 [Karstenula rhodostoma CBS 690.94]